MNKTNWQRHRGINLLQSILLIAALCVTLGSLGWALAGPDGTVLALFASLMLVVFNPGFSTGWTLRMYGAEALSRRRAPGLVQLLETLSQRAELPSVPTLYYIPSRMMNAFAVGSPGNAAVAVTDGLLRQLSMREVAGVLAHEVSHLRHNDMWVMGLADVFSRLTQALSLAGQLLLLLNLPLWMLGYYTVSWMAVIILLFAPTVAALAQLALSRTREYDADLGAAELTGDPRGLALALNKLEAIQGGFLEQILMPGRRVPDPSLLRTHPPTEERVRRLLALEEPHRRLPEALVQEPVRITAHPAVQRRPRWRVGGLWY